jgi:hypothetical protein
VIWLDNHRNPWRIGIDHTDSWMEVNMAQVTEVKLIDDLDGGEADETVTFTLDGKAFEIDLNGKNAASLRDALAPFVGAARRAGGVPTVARTKSYARSTRSRQETAEIREWADANGHSVSARGRIPSAVIEAYANRGSAPVAAAKVEAPVAQAEVKPKRRTRKKADA